MSENEGIRLAKIIAKAIGPADQAFHHPAEKGAPEVDVNVFRPRRGSIALLVTAGASTQPMQSPPGHPRFELYCKLQATQTTPGHVIESVCQALWLVAQNPFRGGKALDVWHTFGKLPPLAEGSALNAFMFLPPPPGDGPILAYERALGSQVMVLHAVGITEGERQAAEHAHLRDDNLRAFAQQLFGKNPPITDVSRGENIGILRRPS